MKTMNNSKNKLNSEIILIFNPNPNAHIVRNLGQLNRHIRNIKDSGGYHQKKKKNHLKKAKIHYC